MKPQITIYTDGACQPNPGPGGWAAILLRPQAEPEELCGAELYTSNNRMEMQAVLAALRHLAEPHRITLYTDSNYLRRGITEWVAGWQKRGWQTAANKAVQNKDLWQALLAETARHQIEWRWVKGHAGDKWNERADVLARSMIPTESLPLADEQAVHIFTAAACRGSYGPGGWGVVLRYGEETTTLSGHYDHTSANRMQLMAALKGLQIIDQPLTIHLYTNSSYLYDGITRWVKQWQKRDWHTKSGQPVKHRELWEALLAAAARRNVEWHLVKSSDDPPPEMAQAKELAG